MNHNLKSIVTLAVTTWIVCSWAAAPSGAEPWDEMDYGPYLTATIEAPWPRGNIAQKGVLIRLDKQTQTSVVFDTDLMRYSAGWTGGLIQWRNVVFDGSHGNHPTITGSQVFGSPVMPGWADAKASLADPRLLGRDGRRFGPLPREHAHWKGLYLHGERVVLSYTVGTADVLETPGRLSRNGLSAFTRTVQLGKSERDLTLQVCQSPRGKLRLLSVDGLVAAGAKGPASERMLLFGADEGHAPDGPKEQDVAMGPRAIGLVGQGKAIAWQLDDASQVRLRIPAAATPCRFQILIGYGAVVDAEQFAALLKSVGPPVDLAPLTRGGPPRWPETLTTQGRRGQDDDPYTIDTITLPAENPWKSWMRLGGFDFFPGGGRAAVCTWSGDVWLVDGIDASLAKLRWKRIATGMFQPLGLKIVDGKIYVSCRDQITRLHDLDGDEEIDFYENFNNDHQVTEHFHEFAMDLQTDRDGNFYYAKSARHAKSALVPHHGTLIKVSKDGRESRIVCNGFRAANGVAIGPGGELVTSDQEGHWTPANRINLVQPGGFYGNMYSYHQGARPTGYAPPLCWLPTNVDRSPAEQLWVDSRRWGPLAGSLLSMSYGTGQLFLVPYERVGGQAQGGVVRFPLSFPTGIMRGRFHPGDGQLYLCGLVGWSSNTPQPGGFYRVRYTGRPVHMPVEFHAAADGISLTFTEPLDRASAEQVDNYSLKQWNYRWTATYGSEHYRVSDPARTGFDHVEVRGATLSDDGKTVFLAIDDLGPVMQLQISYTLTSSAGTRFNQDLYSTINALGKSRGGPAPTDVPRRPRALRVDQALNLRRGLLLRLEQDADGAEPPKRDTRRVRLAALHVTHGSPPSALLRPGPFRARFEGYLRLDLKGDYTFSLKGRGVAELRVNGKAASFGPGSLADSPAAAFSLDRGYNKLELDYTAGTAGEALLRLYWASESFAAEPVPPQRLFCDGSDAALTTGETLRLGRRLFATRRCAACHRLPDGKSVRELAMPEMSTDSPSLASVGNRLNKDWMYQWMLNPRGLRNDVTMPRLLSADSPADRQKAAHLAAYLASLGKTQAPPPPPPAAHDVDEGEVLFENLGCIGCHTTRRTGAADIFDRVSLELVGGKFKPGALRAYLRGPHDWFAWSRMPDFKLDEREAFLLAAFLRSRSGAIPRSERPVPTGDPLRGKELFGRLGCAHCHAVAKDAPPQRPVDAAIWNTSGERGCLADRAAARVAAPDFGLNERQRQALAALLRSGGRSLARHVPAEAAQRYVRSLRCTTCHKRDAMGGDWPILLAEEGVQGRVPEIVPDLTWLGEKLRPEWTERLLAGNLGYRPRPWLKVRMPAFPARSRSLARGLSAEHGFPSETQLRPPLDPAMVEAGHRLSLKTGGFDCVQCHAVGATPATAAFDSRGVNFSDISARMRYDFYPRWMFNAPRVEPSTKMPRLAPDGVRTALTGVYDGDAHRQFDAIWHYIRSLEKGQAK